MDTLDKFLTEIKKYEDVIIYGYKEIGTCVLNYIISFDTDIKLSNYSGRVRYFAHTNTQDYEHEKKGIPIKCIEDLTDFAEDGLVIIATQEQHHSIIGAKLDTLGFKNRIYISHELYGIMREVVSNYLGIINNEVRQYSLMNEMKLGNLRSKVKAGSTVKVYFMTQRAAAFGCASIYRAMEKSSVFEPYVLCISKRDLWYDRFYEAVEEDVDFFEKHGYRAINAYDKHHMAMDMTQLDPDIIFFDSPNLYGPANNSHFRLDQLNWRFLTCYVPYGLLMVDSFYYHYNNINVRECWKFFLDTPASYDRALSDADFNGMNIVRAGYPKFDDYVTAEKKELPAKLLNDKPTVIYAPHWTLDTENNFGTFDIYYDLMLELVRSNPDINFVFKPHPELGFRIRARYNNDQSDYSGEDYEAYMQTWDELPNGLCITQGDYISIFERSCCLVTDCGSFIGEYLPSLNPCIYLFNPRKKRQMEAYTPLARDILSTYYVTNTAEEFVQNFEKIVIDKNDEKRQRRKEVFEREFSDLGHIGEAICSYLEKQVTEL